jgi:hypothetical protein
MGCLEADVLLLRRLGVEADELDDAELRQLLVDQRQDPRVEEVLELRDQRPDADIARGLQLVLVVDSR